MEGLLESLGHVLSPTPLALLVIGTAAGITAGAIPGLTGAMLISLTLPLTFSMRYENALVLLVAMYVGSVSGGLISATLLRMPGTPASIMTTLDGYPMARAGRPGRALGLGITASLVGGMISWGFLVVLARPIAGLSTRLGPFDLFSLVVIALVLIASVAGRSLVLGLFSGALGILATMPGMSPATGELRWTLGFAELADGLQLLPVLIGLFAVSQVLVDVVGIDREVEPVAPERRGLFMSWKDWKAQSTNLLRSSLIGTGVGILPGVGANVGSILAYSAARGLSKKPEEFGEGSEEGIVASEAANNATVGGALIPLVALGIPGSVIDAILLGALVVHGLQPGPLLFTENPEAVYTIMSTLFVANCAMFAILVAGVTTVARLMYIRRAFLVPVVLTFCVVGSYALSNRMFDVWVMLASGALGCALRAAGIPLAPFVIGFVLAPLAEENLSAGLQLSGGSYAPLVSRPLSLLFLLVSAALVVRPLWQRTRRRQRRPSRIPES